jgi:hypothetical protein
MTDSRKKIDISECDLGIKFFKDLTKRECSSWIKVECEPYTGIRGEPQSCSPIYSEKCHAAGKRLNELQKECDELHIRKFGL